MTSNLRSTAAFTSGVAGYTAASRPRTKLSMASAASRTSHKKARGSRYLDQLAIAVDAGQHIGFAQRGGLDQIDEAPQQLLQLSLRTEKLSQPGSRIAYRAANSTRKSASLAGVKSIARAAEPNTSCRAMR